MSWRSVPVEPTEEQWGGLARDIVMWMRAYSDHSSDTLFKHLRLCGATIPEWLTKECDTGRHTLPKGTVAAIIYKAMVEAAPPSTEGGED